MYLFFYPASWYLGVQGDEATENIQFTPCFGDTCENGGTCTPETAGLFSCSCPKGFGGMHIKNTLN